MTRSRIILLVEDNSDAQFFHAAQQLGLYWLALNEPPPGDGPGLGGPP
jgi:hypothetical protein